MSNLTLYKHDEPRPDVDEMLSDYFQAQLPKPWPAFEAPKAMRARVTPSLWSRNGGRFALAACVALLVAGYWSLSGNLADPHPHSLPRVGPNIGMNPKGVNAPKPHDEPMNPTGPNPRSK